MVMVSGSIPHTITPTDTREGPHQSSSQAGTCFPKSGYWVHWWFYN